MRVLITDVENTTVHRKDGKLDLSPYHPHNTLVSVGLREIVDGVMGEVEYYFFHHLDLEDIPVKDNFRIVQEKLDSADLVVGHNVKHDLSWLWSTGFSYDGPLWDTLLFEYVIARGLHTPLSLDYIAKKRNVTHKKSDLIKDYYKKGIMFDEIPVDIVIEYGSGDIISTSELYLVQRNLLNRNENIGLTNTVQLTNRFCNVITTVEGNGICINLDVLESVGDEFRIELNQLEKDLKSIVEDVMGDTPINLESPEQLSWLVYSREVIDKAQWKKDFKIEKDENGKDQYPPRWRKKTFNNYVKENTRKLLKTKARQCPNCKGHGRYFKKKKDGSSWKKDGPCHDCNSTGLLYDTIKSYAGLKMVPTSTSDAAAGGFSTSKEKLEEFARWCHSKDLHQHYEFFSKVVRRKALSKYIGTYVEGIQNSVVRTFERDGVKYGYVHPQFNQARTRTGRLASPWQIIPRGNTFPVKKSVVSRFDKGTLIEADYSQLEFRVAGNLSKDPNVIHDVLSGVDVHEETAKVLNSAGQPTSRQDAKPHTFKPLYGGMSGTTAEQTYYRAFLYRKYPGINDWHKKLAQEALETKKLVLPSGREYAFPYAERTSYGSVTGITKIKNYPVQGFATADIVLWACVLLQNKLRNRKSVLINQVHDSILVDCSPGEEEVVVQDIKEAMLGVQKFLTNMIGFEWLIPLEIEIKQGFNWLEEKEIGKFK